MRDALFFAVFISAAFTQCTCFAQDSLLANPALVQGSSDTIHNISGVAIGMTCAQAIAAGSAVSAETTGDKVRRPSLGAQGYLREKGEERSTAYAYVTYRVKLSGNSSITDDLEFDCLKDGGDTVFAIRREIQFKRLDVGQAPSVGSLRSSFQEKYGVPTVEFSPSRFATIFNLKGPTSVPDACGPVADSPNYLLGYQYYDPQKCTYILLFAAFTKRENPNWVSAIDIEIRDYKRLADSVRAIIQKRQESTPIVTPKL